MLCGKTWAEGNVMSSTTHDIVQKLWGFCDILRDDGITYHQYVTELTYLLFLKMAKETKTEGQLPENCRWDALVAKKGLGQLTYYKKLLLELSAEGTNQVQAIYADAQTSMREPNNLAKLVSQIDDLNWYRAREEGLGDLYEGLLEKNAGEVKSGAGQYFTPRPLIDAIVALVDPKHGEVIQDPAAGTGGFLIAADRHIKSKTSDLFDLNERAIQWQRSKAYLGVELVPETRRLALMNLMLHGIEGSVQLGDSLSSVGSGLDKADVILTNPPFGSKRGGETPRRDDFTFKTSNKQLAFVQHVYRGLKAGGRAAVVVPDNVLFEDGVGVQIRADMMEKTNLHTILRLPTGIFYAQGVKTNVLFFTRGKSDKGNTNATWIYDMRTNMPSFGKRTPFTRKEFEGFEKAWTMRAQESVDERWRVFSRDEIKKRGDNLDVTWLKDESTSGGGELEEPEVIAAQIVERLEAALAEMKGLMAALEGKT
jgi:type I restriction enzyme M protein